MYRQRVVVAGVGVAIVVAAWTPLGAEQLPLAPGRDSGQTVTPAFEGWYQNPDGTYSLSFGYYNRNFEEELDIPIGPNNRLDPGDPNQGQPTHFLQGRNRGAFAVTVPADFGDGTLVWTLVVRGKTLSVPGHLRRDWQIDAVEGAASGNTPPVLKFDPAGPEGQGPRGITAAPLRVAVANPVTLTVWASDDGVRRLRRRRPARAAEEEEPPVRLRWLRHQGPGTVTFAEPEPPVGGPDGKATTTATFSEPGDYVLRVLATDASGRTPGGNQCCWTNGYVRVTVTQ